VYVICQYAVSCPRVVLTQGMIVPIFSSTLYSILQYSGLSRIQSLLLRLVSNFR
jgi:hypothetical protein